MFKLQVFELSQWDTIGEFSTLNDAQEALKIILRIGTYRLDDMTIVKT